MRSQASRELALVLETPAAESTPRALDVGRFHHVLGGLSSREFAAAAEAVPKIFRLGHSSMARRFIRAGEAFRRFLRAVDGSCPMTGARARLEGVAADQLKIALGASVTGRSACSGWCKRERNTRACVLASCGSWTAVLQPDGGFLVVLDGEKSCGHRARGLRGAGHRPALPVAQTRETGCATSREGSNRSGAEAASGLRAPIYAAAKAELVLLRARLW
jgi:hypothetical protein